MTLSRELFTGEQQKSHDVILNQVLIEFNVRTVYRFLENFTNYSKGMKYLKEDINEF